MKRFLEDHRTLVGFVGIGLFALAVATLSPVALTFWLIWTIAQILLLIAIMFVLYRLHRERRPDIALWSTRAQWAFYGGAAIIAAELLIAFLPLGIRLEGLTLLAWVFGIGIGGYAMFRVWRDEHTYS
jgi:hypothetical protein